MNAVLLLHLELPDHPVLQVGGHHHPVPRSIRELCALSRDTLGQIGPSTIVTNTADIVTGLELGDTVESDLLTVTCGWEGRIVSEIWKSHQQLSR